MQKIIIAPLNWGLGHATRCIPIIKAMIENNIAPVIASDGNALLFLQKEFPTLEMLELPSYNISYGKNLKLQLILQFPKIWKAVKKEQKIIDSFIAKDKQIIGVISDNRFGVRSSKVPSVYITHQLNVLSGFTTFFTSKIHQNIIKKFDECWIPDNKNSTFSGKLSILQNRKISTKFIGVLSRFKLEETKKTIAILAIISGVEPNRTSLEKKLIKEFSNYQGNVVLVQGKIAQKQVISAKNGITIYNFVLSEELERLINSAKIIVCRSGYSSIMDLAVLNKKVFFIPTKQQTEQEYLATYLSENKIAPFASEEKFTAKMLEEIDSCSGLSSAEAVIDFNLFSLFKRK